jgi:hypothetical protein
VVTSLLKNPLAFVFRKPVTAEEAPDYDVVIKRRMDLSTLKRRLQSGELATLADFKRDLDQIWTNACTYNLEGSDIWKLAQSLRTLSAQELAEALPPGVTDETAIDGAMESKKRKSTTSSTASREKKRRV